MNPKPLVSPALITLGAAALFRTEPVAVAAGTLLAWRRKG
jgi:hypothetical protein